MGILQNALYKAIVQLGKKQTLAKLFSKLKLVTENLSLYDSYSVTAIAVETTGVDVWFIEAVEKGR